MSTQTGRGGALHRGRLYRFGSIIAALIVVGFGFTMWTSRQQGDDLGGVRAAGEATLSLEQSIGDGQAIATNIFAKSVALSSQAGDLADQFTTALRQSIDDITSHIDEVRAYVTSSGVGRAEFQTLDEALKAWLPSLDALIGLSTPIVLDQTTYAAAVKPYTDLREAQEALSDVLENQGDVIRVAADDTATRGQLISLVAALAALTGLGWVGLKVVRSVDRTNSMQVDMERVTQMIEQSPAAMMAVNLDGTCTYVNPAGIAEWQRMEHVLPCRADELQGATIASLANPGSLPATRMIERGEFHLELVLSPLTNADGTQSMLVTFRDVTDATRLHDEAAHLQQREQRQAAELQTKVDRLVEAVNRIAEGDLTVDVPISGADAAGQMGDALNRLLGELRTSIASIAGNAQVLAASAEELETVSRQMGASSASSSQQVTQISRASLEVNRNVDSVSAGTEQMSASIKEIARNATHAAEVAGQAVHAVRATNDQVAQLGASSAEIGEIVKVITDIAQQTNLLALNATIEAARAGEAGKGFAVVAGEVKDLAKDTAHATENIVAKVTAIQHDTQQSITSISSILDIINEISTIQEAIASAVEQQAATTADIARSLEVASKGSDEITASMRDVADATEQTATGATDSQRAAAELAKMAEDLRHAVSAFNYTT